MDTNRPFVTWPQNLIIPPASRRVRTPVDGADVKVVSDLVPTVAISPTWPQRGVTTYGTLPYSNVTDGRAAFASWIYQNIEGDREHPDFTRLNFAPDLSASSTTPYDTMWTSEVVSWPSVLEFFKDFRNPNAPVGVSTSSGTKYIPRFTVVYGLRRSVTGHSKMRIRKFVSNTPFSLDGKVFKMFMPTDIMWDMPGTTGSIERCLHKLIKVRSARDNLDWAVDTPRYMVFPSTELEDWAPITWWECNMVDVLYTMDEYKIYPPPRLQASIYVE